MSTKRVTIADIESIHGKPLRAILLDAFARYRTYEKAARALGIAFNTFASWVQAAGLRYERGVGLVDNPDAHCEEVVDWYSLTVLVCPVCGAEMSLSLGFWRCPLCGWAIQDGLIEIEEKNGNQYT